MTWTLRSWVPGTEPRQFVDVEEYQDWGLATDHFSLRAYHLRLSGGACELITPTGDVAASVMCAGGAQ